MKDKKLSPIESDLWRHYGRTGCFLLMWATLHNRTFAPLATLRMLQETRKFAKPLRLFLLPLLNLFHRWATQRAAIDLPKSISIGPGFRITHGWGMVFNKDAVLGSNVTVMHGVTLGGKDGCYPHIGNNVFIGAHAIVLGRVSVGDGAIIGPGCVVTKDVSAGTTVVGNPQREIGPAVEPMGNFFVPAAMLPKVGRGH